MTESAADRPATPWHVWAVGIVTLLWNAVGASDYVMTQIRYEPYMSQFTAEQLEFFYGFPAWANGAWAVGVWGAVAGSVLLLLRSRFALHAFVASFAAMVLTTVHNFGLADGLKITGPGALAFSAVIFVIALALVFYTRAMARAGVLR